MKENALKTRLALIFVGGHALVLLAAAAAATLVKMKLGDAFTLALISSAVLATGARSAFDYIQGPKKADTSLEATRSKVWVNQIVVCLLIGLVLICYVPAFFETRFTVDDMKLGIALAETALGGYVGSLRDGFLRRR